MNNYVISLLIFCFREFKINIFLFLFRAVIKTLNYYFTVDDSFLYKHKYEK